MKIYVCVKQVPDTESKLKINADKNGIDTNGIKWVMNPYDEFAVEEAIKLKESNSEAKVTVVGLGPKKRVIDSLRTALAMGADDAMVIDAPENLDVSATAKGLAAAIKAKGDHNLIFTGKLAIDDNAASVSQMLAETLEIPHTTVVNKFEYASEKVIVEREVEGGTKEVVQMSLPAVVGANKGLNMPRYASLPGIMKAKKKPVEEIEFSSLGVGDDAQKVAFVDFALPPEKPACKMIDGDAGAQAKSLAGLLREEAKVL